jgi:enoyl-CoA hydratase/carnithine racemase
VALVADRLRVVANAQGGELRVEDFGRVRVLTWDRPHRLNAWNEQTYGDTTDAIVDAAVDPSVAVLVLTGAGRAFTSGGDTTESKASSGNWDDMGQGGVGARNVGKHGFVGLIDQVAAFPKPLLCAVNGITVGGGTAVIGLADLVVMSTDARVCAPFPKMGVSPEGGLSFTLPQLMGRSNAMWALLSGEWISAQDCYRSGLAWRLTEPDQLMDDVMSHAHALAELPLAVLIETKKLIREPFKHQVADARDREVDRFRQLLTTQASREGLLAHQARTTPNYPDIDDRHPVTTTVLVHERVSRLRDNWEKYRAPSNVPDLHDEVGPAIDSTEP